jgi:hypothetical protein
MKSKPPKTAPLTIGVQDYWMRQIFPGFRFSRSMSSWVGSLKPSENSPEYIVRISYKLTDIPRVVILKPAIREDAPHRFEDGSLCLYYFKDGSWERNKRVAQTILPWTAEWLCFYEIWLATGEWIGAEAPHLGKKKR